MPTLNSLSNTLDPNASSPNRIRRNFQRLQKSKALNGISSVTAPLSYTGGVLSLTIATTGGLQSASGLAILNDPNGGLTSTSTGEKIKLPSTSGLSLSSSGLVVETANNSLALTSGGITFNPATNGGLEIVSGGVLVEGFRTAASSPLSLDGDTYYDTTYHNEVVQEFGVLKDLIGKVYATLADSASVSNVSNVGSPTVVENTFIFPANFWTVGKSVRLTAIGTYGTKAGTNSTTPTYSPITAAQFLPWVNFVNGATVVNLAAPTWSVAYNASGARWYSSTVLTCRSTGSSGSFGRIGFLAVEDQSATLFTGYTFIAAGGRPVTINTTLAQTVEVTIAWNTADPANTALLHELLIEVM